MLGTIEHLVDPVLPRLLSVVREQIGDRELHVRIDRSAAVGRGVARGEIDAAIMLDPLDVPDPVELGQVTVALVARAPAGRPAALPSPCRSSPTTPPCALRDLALARVQALGADIELTAESPHMTGVHAAAAPAWATRLLLAGADGLARVRHRPAGGRHRHAGLAGRPRRHRELVAPLRAAAWRALRSAALADAAAA